jgi:hypothetical protein
MKTYGIGLHHVRVYERSDTRPRDAMRAVADGCEICFVDRVVDGGGAIDTDAMTEALVRHRRLKIGMAGPFELGVLETFSERLSGQLKAWAAHRPSLPRAARGPASARTKRLADSGSHQRHSSERLPPP